MKIKLIGVVSAVLISFSGAAFADTEICMALDGSGSVGSTNFGVLLEGTASAIEDPAVVPQNSSVIISVVQFGVGAQVEVSPTTINNQGTADSVAATIRAISYLSGIDTNIPAAIALCEGQFAYAGGDTQVIDVVTDGVSSGDPSAAADTAVTAGVDSINALGIGGGVSVPDLNSFVRPQPPSVLGVGDGFVVLVPTFQDFAPAIAEKIQQEVAPEEIQPVPTLSEWATILLALLFAGMAGMRLHRGRVS